MLQANFISFVQHHSGVTRTTSSGEASLPKFVLSAKDLSMEGSPRTGCESQSKRLETAQGTSWTKGHFKIGVGLDTCFG